MSKLYKSAISELPCVCSVEAVELTVAIIGTRLSLRSISLLILVISLFPHSFDFF